MVIYEQLTYVTMSETTPEDHLIILRELLADNKTLAMSSSKVTSELYRSWLIL